MAEKSTAEPLPESGRRLGVWALGAVLLALGGLWWRRSRSRQTRFLPDSVSTDWLAEHARDYEEDGY